MTSWRKMSNTRKKILLSFIKTKLWNSSKKVELKLANSNGSEFNFRPTLFNWRRKVGIGVGSQKSSFITSDQKRFPREKSKDLKLNLLRKLSWLSLEKIKNTTMLMFNMIRILTWCTLLCKKVNFRRSLWKFFTC